MNELKVVTKVMHGPILVMQKQGKTPQEIAAVIGCHDRTVRKILNDYGLYFRIRKIDWNEVSRLNREGLSDSQIAKRLGCSEGSVRRILDKPKNYAAR